MISAMLDAVSAASERVRDDIFAHRNSIIADEAAFDEKGVALNLALADQTLAAEIAAFQRFAKSPCHTAADVQAKLLYVLHGSVGQRNTLLSCLQLEEYHADQDQDPMSLGLTEHFLNSLIIAVDDEPSAVSFEEREAR